MPRVAIALGSNLGDRRAALAFAAEHLSSFISSLVVSDAVETEPEGPGLEDHPLFLNAVGVGETDLSPRALLDGIFAIEAAFGRERAYPNAPRTLDLDLILFGDRVIDEPGLQVPHPRFRERFFVLGPLAEIAGEMVDPVSGLSVGNLLKNLLRDETR